MSIRHLNWALRQEGLSGAEKSTLLCLCSALDESGRWYIKHETLAIHSGNSRQTVVNHLKKLVEKYQIEVRRTRNAEGRQGYNEYFFDLDRVKKDDSGKNQSQAPQVQSQAPQVQSQADSVPESSSLTTITTQNSPRTLPELSQSDFAAFWTLYPRKVGKGSAEKAWPKACKRAPPSEIIAGLKKQIPYLAEQYRGPGEDFRPHPATWLNGAHWENQHDPPPMSKEQMVDDALREKWRREDAGEQDGNSRTGDPAAGNILPSAAVEIH